MPTAPSPGAAVGRRAGRVAGHEDQQLALGHPPEQERGVGTGELARPLHRELGQSLWLQDAAGSHGDLVQQSERIVGGRHPLSALAPAGPELLRSYSSPRRRPRRLGSAMVADYIGCMIQLPMKGRAWREWGRRRWRVNGTRLATTR